MTTTIEKSHLANLVLSKKDEAPSKSEWFAYEIEAPRDRAFALLDDQSSEHGCYFSSNGQHLVGVGKVFHHKLFGPQRFFQAKQALSKSLTTLGLPDAMQAKLRFFCGAAFSSSGQADDSCWKTFGDASVILPEFTYSQCDDARPARLLGVAKKAETDQHIDRLWQVFSCSSAPIDRDELTVRRCSSSADEQRWQQLLATIERQINEGQAQKIVAARRMTYELSGTPRLSSVLSRFGELSPSCTHFACRIGEKTFVGATPETLVLKSGLEVRTEALAGSSAFSPQDAARREQLLLENPKELAEHAFVACALTEQLRQICHSVTFDASPEVRKLKNLLHLWTPISGTLQRDEHILSLVERLHPTPAVGGSPRAQAIRWIEANEPVERGWYAAPFGYVSAAGDGHFVVGLRSALIHQNKCHVYAGAGIVKGSEPAREFEETRLKLASMLGALGIAD